MNSEIVKFPPTSQSYIKYKLVLLLLTIWGGGYLSRCRQATYIPWNSQMAMIMPLENILL